MSYFPTSSPELDPSSTSSIWWAFPKSRSIHPSLPGAKHTCPSTGIPPVTCFRGSVWVLGVKPRGTDSPKENSEHRPSSISLCHRAGLALEMKAAPVSWRKHPTPPETSLGVLFGHSSLYWRANPPIAKKMSADALVTLWHLRWTGWLLLDGKVRQVWHMAGRDSSPNPAAPAPATVQSFISGRQHSSGRTKFPSLHSRMLSQF